MQLITVRRVELAREKLSRSLLKFLAAGLTLVAAGWLSAQTPTPTAPAPQKPEQTVEPAAPPAESGVIYIVKRGDTLWEIAKKYLEDPFRWPEVFQRNTDVVANPHWIHPGDVIRISASEVRPEVLAHLTIKPAASEPTGLGRTVFSTLPVYTSDRIPGTGEVLGRYQVGVVRVGEVEAAPYVDRVGASRGAGRLAAAYDRPGTAAKASDQHFQIQDAVFVEVPNGQAARLGDRYLVVVPGPSIDEGSQVMIPTGIVRIESVDPGQPALARIIRQFGDIRIGQRLVAVERTALALTASRIPSSSGRSAHVLWLHNDPVLPTLQSYVVLSLEAGNDVSLGDQFTLIDATVDVTHHVPQVPAAVAQVVRVTPFAITALIVDHDQPTVKVGMSARLTTRMR